MKGAPSVYATKQDYLNAAQLFPKEASAALRNLMDGRYIWQEASELTMRSDGLDDATHRIIETIRDDVPDGNSTSVLIQMVKVEDQNSAFFRMGWTVKDAETFISHFGA